MWQGLDRRRFPRAHFPCRIIVKAKTQKGSFDTHTENIGAGGVCVILEKHLPQFSELELVLYLEDGGSPIECNAKIVWAIQRGSLDKAEPEKFDTGIEFMDIKEADKKRIEKIVQEFLSTNEEQ